MGSWPFFSPGLSSCARAASTASARFCNSVDERPAPDAAATATPAAKPHNSFRRISDSLCERIGRKKVINLQTTEEGKQIVSNAECGVRNAESKTEGEAEDKRTYS